MKGGVVIVIAESETSSERRVLGDGRFQRLCFLPAKLTFVASLTSQAAGAAKAESSKPSCQSAIATPGASMDRGLIAAGYTCPVMPKTQGDVRAGRLGGGRPLSGAVASRLTPALACPALAILLEADQLLYLPACSCVTTGLVNDLSSVGR